MGRSRPICKSWQEGNCFDDYYCLRRHYYTENDEELPQCKRFLDVEYGSDRAQVSPQTFSSPYKVRIKKEEVKKRKVEVDLETGRKKSWVETMEQEVVDLTGDVSAKKPIRSPMADRTNLMNVQAQSKIPIRIFPQLPCEISVTTGDVSAKKPIRSPMADRTNLMNVQAKSKIPIRIFPNIHVRDKKLN